MRKPACQHHLKHVRLTLARPFPNRRQIGASLKNGAMALSLSLGAQFQKFGLNSERHPAQHRKDRGPEKIGNKSLNTASNLTAHSAKDANFFRINSVFF